MVKKSQHQESSITTKTEKIFFLYQKYAQREMDIIIIILIQNKHIRLFTPN